MQEISLPNLKLTFITVTFQKFIILKYSNLLIMSYVLCCHRFHYKPTAFFLLSKQKKRGGRGRVESWPIRQWQVDE